MLRQKKNTNHDIVDKFYDAYKNHDINAIGKVMADDVTWYFLSQSPAGGVKHGINEVVEFFDTMAEIMAQSDVRMDKLIVEENDRYLIECQRSKTNRKDGNNLEHHSAVLWTIENGKIIEGRHFFADPQAADKYFSAVVSAVVPKTNVFHE